MAFEYETEIKDNIQSFAITRQKAIENCMNRIPISYNKNERFLALYEDGSFLGISNSENGAQQIANNWIWEFGSDHLKQASHIQWGKNHHYYIVDLNPATNWSKKYRASCEQLTPIFEYAYFGAKDFYDKEYFVAEEKARNEKAHTSWKTEIERKKEETSKLWLNLLGGAMFLYWIFGGFSCVNA